MTNRKFPLTRGAQLAGPGRVASFERDQARRDGLPAQLTPGAYTRLAGLLTRQAAVAPAEAPPAEDAPSIANRARKFATMAEVEAAGFRRVGSALYVEKTAATKTAHPIWELRAADDAGFVLVRTREERDVDLRVAGQAGEGTLAAIDAGLVRSGRRKTAARRKKAVAVSEWYAVVKDDAFIGGGDLLTEAVRMAADNVEPPWEVVRLKNVPFEVADKLMDVPPGYDSPEEALVALAPYVEDVMADSESEGAFGYGGEDWDDDSDWEREADQLPGGLADDADPTEFDSEAVGEGIEHELSEHTNDPAVATEIALDHLVDEGEDYYDTLEEAFEDKEGRRAQMEVVDDEVWLCQDCTMAAVNGDLSGLDYYLEPDEAEKRVEEIEAGLADLGPNLVPNFSGEDGEGELEFAKMPCESCGEHLAGARFRFSILAPAQKKDAQVEDNEGLKMIPWPPEYIDISPMQYWWAGQGDVLYYLYSTRDKMVPAWKIEKAITQIESSMALDPEDMEDDGTDDMLFELKEYLNQQYEVGKQAALAPGMKVLAVRKDGSVADAVIVMVHPEQEAVELMFGDDAHGGVPIEDGHETIEMAETEMIPIEMIVSPTADTEVMELDSGFDGGADVVEVGLEDLPDPFEVELGELPSAEFEMTGRTAAIREDDLFDAIATEFRSWKGWQEQRPICALLRFTPGGAAFYPFDEPTIVEQAEAVYHAAPPEALQAATPSDAAAMAIDSFWQGRTFDMTWEAGVLQHSPKDWNFLLKNLCRLMGNEPIGYIPNAFAAEVEGVVADIASQRQAWRIEAIEWTQGLVAGAPVVTTAAFAPFYHGRTYQVPAGAEYTVDGAHKLGDDEFFGFPFLGTPVKGGVPAQNARIRLTSPEGQLMVVTPEEFDKFFESGAPTAEPESGELEGVDEYMQRTQLEPSQQPTEVSPEVSSMPTVVQRPRPQQPIGPDRGVSGLEPTRVR